MAIRCILCGTKTNRITHPQFGEYHACSECKLISKDKEQLLTEEEERKNYDFHENSIDDPRYVDFFYKFLNDAVFPYANEPVRALDFGSGPSPVLAQILERFHGYEVDIYDLYYAPEKVYEGKTYNLITATEVVEHLHDPLPYFQLLSDLLEPGGILAVMTLFHPQNEEQFLGWHYIRDGSHVSFYTPETMQYIASKKGMDLIHTNDVRYTTFKKRGATR